MSEPKVIYLGPACEAEGDGRTWAEDDAWSICECGKQSVQYVLGADFDRVTAERDALQLRLNAADQRIDELISAVRSINRGPRHEVFVPGDDEPQYRQRKEWVDWVLSLCDEASATVDPASPAPETSRRTDEVQIKGMIEARGGKFAIMIDQANAHYGWTFQRHPDGMWVSGRKATDAEMHAARTHARITNQQ